MVDAKPLIQRRWSPPFPEKEKTCRTACAVWRRLSQVLPAWSYAAVPKGRHWIGSTKLNKPVIRLKAAFESGTGLYGLSIVRANNVSGSGSWPGSRLVARLDFLFATAAWGVGADWARQGHGSRLWQISHAWAQGYLRRSLLRQPSKFRA